MGRVMSVVSLHIEPPSYIGKYEYFEKNDILVFAETDTTTFGPSFLLREYKTIANATLD